MGTHCQLVVRQLNGELHRYERTMDGNKFVDALKSWSYQPEIEKSHEYEYNTICWS